MLNRRDAMKGVAAGIAAVGVCPAVSAGHLSYASLRNQWAFAHIDFSI